MTPVEAPRASDVVAITPAAVAEVAAGIARAFLDNEIWEWMIPSRRRRSRALERYYVAAIRHVFTPRGTAWMTTDRRGASLWSPPGRWELSTREQIREATALIRFCGPATLSRGAKLERVFAEHHPREPHWYLDTLTVDPELQRGGYGTALITAGLERADADQLGAYLETQTESNLPYYARFGFELTRRVTIPNGPNAWMMWRPPRG